METIVIDGKGSCTIEGTKYPGIGFGTYPFTGDVCFKAVMQAGNLGYRIIDTATFYRNFIPIGEAMKKLGREKYYIISKVWPTDQTPEGIKMDIKATLEQLQTSYLDAYLIHWPNSNIPLEDTLSTMDALRKAGTIRHIGLSNVTIPHLKRALELNIPITWVQIEMHPQFFDPELIKFCQDHSIGVQAWSPLGRGRLSEDKELKILGQKYGKTAAQIALKWIVQHQCLPLPGSQNADHMRENLNISDFTLSEEDMALIDSKARQGKRTRISGSFGLGFSDEFDFTYEQCWPKY